MSTTRGQHLIGQEIGSCILVKLLGYGGTSAVFLARSCSTDEIVAIKVFLPRSTMDKQMQRNFYHRFLREAQAASELDHSNILSIYSYGEHQGLPYIIMPYMPGGTLSEYVAKHGPLSLGEAQKYLEQISSALDYAHEHGCVHCDVKPANILLDGAGHVVLSDFGIVRLMQPDSGSAQQSMKSPETLMGTPDYISPEQALGEPLDGRSDIYSLAVTLFFLLAGSPPFKADSSIAMALMHVHETPPALGTIRVESTPQIDRIIAKALSKWPEERYQTAGEFSVAFAEAVANADLDGNAKRRANGFAAGTKAAAILKPIVRIKPIRKSSFKPWRVILPLVLVLAVIIGSIMSVIIFNSLAAAHSQAQHSSNTEIDYLANEKDEWPISSTYFFLHNQYHIKNTSAQQVAMAFYSFGRYEFSNSRLTVTTSEVRGSQDDADYYGVVFRSSTDQSHYYLFEIATWMGGQYDFYRYDVQRDGKDPWHHLAFGPVPNFKRSNVLTVVAKGKTFNLYVNQKALGNPIIDTMQPALISGEIGLSVEEQNTEVAFSQLHIDKL